MLMQHIPYPLLNASTTLTDLLVPYPLIKPDIGAFPDCNPSSCVHGPAAVIVERSLIHLVTPLAL